MFHPRARATVITYIGIIIVISIIISVSISVSISISISISSGRQPCPACRTLFYRLKLNPINSLQFTKTTTDSRLPSRLSTLSTLADLLFLLVKIHPPPKSASIECLAVWINTPRDLPLLV